MTSTFYKAIVLGLFATAVSVYAGPNAAPKKIAIPLSDHAPSLGYAYNSRMQNFYQACVQAKNGSNPTNPTGNATLLLGTSYSDSSSSMGFDVGGRYRTGVIDVSASASFARSSEDTGYTVNFIYQS